MDKWRRVAIKERTGKQLDVLLALTNGSRSEKLKLYEMLGQMVALKWNEAKSRGLVTDAMLVEPEEQQLEPHYENILVEGGSAIL